MNIISIGEVLWDLVGETEYLGGAPFNFAAHLGKLGHTVSFISAVGNDARGQRILDSMSQMDLTTRYVRQIDNYPTGTASVNFDAQGQPHFIIARPAAYDFPQLTEKDFAELLSQPIDWIYFGTLQQMSPNARQLTDRLLNSREFNSELRTRHFYDVNLRSDSYEPALVLESLAQATVVKLNDTEVEEIVAMVGETYASLEEFCRSYSAKFGWEAVCITQGAQGCALLIGNEYVAADGYSVTVADYRGSGRCLRGSFRPWIGKWMAGTANRGLRNRVGALVASRPGAIPSWRVEEAEASSP